MEAVKLHKFDNTFPVCKGISLFISVHFIEVPLNTAHMWNVRKQLIGKGKSSLCDWPNYQLALPRLLLRGLPWRACPRDWLKFKSRQAQLSNPQPNPSSLFLSLSWQRNHIQWVTWTTPTALSIYNAYMILKPTVTRNAGRQVLFLIFLYGFCFLITAMTCHLYSLIIPQSNSCFLVNFFSNLVQSTLNIN